MNRKWLFLIGWLALVLAQPASGMAQEREPEDDVSCVTCHEHRYYLYDTGKWFCLFNAPMQCVYCHGGQAGTLDKETAHQGLTLHPTRNQAGRCQACHAGDTLARVATFEAVAGAGSSGIFLKTGKAVELEPDRDGDAAAALRLHFGQLEPWRMAALVGLGILLIGNFALGWVCWKADCRARIHSTRSRS